MPPTCVATVVVIQTENDIKKIIKIHYAQVLSDKRLTKFKGLKSRVKHDIGASTGEIQSFDPI